VPDLKETLLTRLGIAEALGHRAKAAAGRLQQAAAKTHDSHQAELAQLRQQIQAAGVGNDEEAEQRYCQLLVERMHLTQAHTLSGMDAARMPEVGGPALAKARRSTPTGMASLFEEEEHPRLKVGETIDGYKPGEFIPKAAGRKERGDVHRPAEMVPGDYEYLATSYPVEEEGEHGTIRHIEWDGTDEWTEMGRPTRSTAAHTRDGNCDHCGAAHTYQVILRHKPTGALVSVGHQCYEQRFSVPGWQNVIADKARRAALKLKREANVAAALAAMDETERTAFQWGESDPNAHPIAQDLAHKAAQYGPLSDKQKALLVKIHRETLERAAKKAEEEANAEPVPEGKVVVRGTILGFKTAETDFGTTTKMVIRDDRGFKVYGTRPAEVYRADGEKGDRIEFTATLERSKDDPFFGFFRRPTKTRIIEQTWRTAAEAQFVPGVKVRPNEQNGDDLGDLDPSQLEGVVLTRPFRQHDGRILVEVAWGAHENHLHRLYPIEWLTVTEPLQKARGRASFVPPDMPNWPAERPRPRDSYHPLNGVEDKLKMEQMAAAMRRGEWTWTVPLVRCGDQLLTGSHRYHAAQVARVPLETVPVDDVFREAGLDFKTTWEANAQPYDGWLSNMDYAVKCLPAALREKYGIDLG
jgi:hypothetical protein